MDLIFCVRSVFLYRPYLYLQQILVWLNRRDKLTHKGIHLAGLECYIKVYAYSVVTWLTSTCSALFLIMALLYPLDLIHCQLTEVEHCRPCIQAFLLLPTHNLSCTPSGSCDTFIETIAVLFAYNLIVFFFHHFLYISLIVNVFLMLSHLTDCKHFHNNGWGGLICLKCHRLNKMTA